MHALSLSKKIDKQVIHAVLLLDDNQSDDPCLVLDIADPDREDLPTATLNCTKLKS